MKAPLFTEQTECRDCYKCIRFCPVKAIRVHEHHANIDSDRCVLCGNCMNVCPNGAQQVRQDSPRVQQLFNLKKEVYLSLAPSFAAEFDESPELLIRKLSALGFAGISETAHGADAVSMIQMKQIRTSHGVTISSACPTVVALINRYYPELNSAISPLLSPMQVHGKQLRARYGESIGVVFAGPCTAKKMEADAPGSSVDVAITFTELAELLTTVKTLPETEIPVIPCRPNRGVLYPIDGGMLATFSKGGTSTPFLPLEEISLSGMDAVIHALDELRKTPRSTRLFCEFLACEGGCINGSGSCSSASLVTRRLKLAHFCTEKSTLPAGTDSFPHLPEELLHRSESPLTPVVSEQYSAEAIAHAFEALSKPTEADQLNCGGCGYNSCVDFATAWLSGLAEQPMCVTSMRERAVNKVNALIKTIPMGVVIVDRQHRTVDCNHRFLRLFLDEELALEEPNRFRNVAVGQFIPIEELIAEVQQSGISRETIVKHNGRVLQVVLFPIEQSGATGILFQDITDPSMKRETVIKKAEEVIHKNLQSVQKIASLLGENAAETEIILNSLIDAFDTGGMA